MARLQWDSFKEAACLRTPAPPRMESYCVSFASAESPARVRRFECEDERSLTDLVGAS